MSLDIENFEEFKSNVIEAYWNGVDNNPEFFAGSTVREVALDMIAYDWTLEDYLDEEGDDEELIKILISILEYVHHDDASSTEEDEE